MGGDKADLGRPGCGSACLAIVLLFVIALAASVSAYSPLGSGCSYSRGCAEGYCLNSTCRFPSFLDKFDVTGDCNSTIDCGEGFCKSGQCIVPSATDYGIFTPGMGIKSSCAGLIDNCTGLWCLFCNATWLILVIGAAGAAFVSRKGGRMMPVVMFMLPMIAGLVFFPVIGFILAVLEIFLIAFSGAPSSGTARVALPPAKPPFAPPAAPPSVKPPAAPPQTETPPTQLSDQSPMEEFL